MYLNRLLIFYYHVIATYKELMKYDIVIKEPTMCETCSNVPLRCSDGVGAGAF